MSKQETNNQPAKKSSNFTGLGLAAYILMIIATVATSILLIPMAWCIPMTISVKRNYQNKKPNSTALKVCTLLFMGVIPGILLLVDSEH